MIYSGNENYAIEYYVKLVIKNKLVFFLRRTKTCMQNVGQKKKLNNYIACHWPIAYLDSLIYDICLIGCQMTSILSFFYLDLDTSQKTIESD